MKGLTPMERELLRSVDQLRIEAEERERRLTEQIGSLTTDLQRLERVCDSLLRQLATG